MKEQAIFDKIDLHMIRVLHTVLTERNVSRAALRLGMYQPAVSATLRRLRI
jgi:DNA-binding transcriptional LysR family regulator